MTVQELMNELEKIEDKDKTVRFFANGTWEREEIEFVEDQHSGVLLG